MAFESERQTRRLQLSGGSTYIISLPKNWIESFSMKVGDTVTIVKNSNKSLTIFPGLEQQNGIKKEATIILGQKDSPENVSKKIISTYLAGYKSIQIKSKGVRIQPEHSRLIRNLVRSSMIGTEIVESSSEKILIQILTRLPELSFEMALKRMHLMTVNLLKESIESLANADKHHADEVIQMDDEVDRFSLYMRRNLTLAVDNAKILGELGLQKPSDCLGYRAVISRIERIADHGVLIAKRVKFLDGIIDPRLMRKLAKVSDESLKVFENSVAALINRNFSKAEKVSDEIKTVVQSEKDIMSTIKESTKNSTVIRFVLEDIRRVAEYSSDIAEVAIDENIHSVISEK